METWHFFLIVWFLSIFFDTRFYLSDMHYYGFGCFSSATTFTYFDFVYCFSWECFLSRPGTNSTMQRRADSCFLRPLLCVSFLCNCRSPFPSHPRAPHLPACPHFPLGILRVFYLQMITFLAIHPLALTSSHCNIFAP